MNDTTTTQLIKTIKPVYHTNLEKDLYAGLISQFYLQNTDDTEVEKIIIELYNNFDDHEVSLGDITSLKDKMYNGEVEPNSGVDGISKLLTKTYNKKTSKETVTQLKKVVKRLDPKNTLGLQLTKTKSLRLDAGKLEVTILSISFNRKGEDDSDYLRVLSCYPNRIIIHDNPISDAGRTFSIDWITKNGGSFKTESMLIPEIETYLENHGYVLSPKNLRGTVAGILQISIDNNLAILKNDIETPGFYWNEETGSIDIVDYEYTSPTIDELTKSLMLIEELADYFKDHEDKLATTLKHSLVAPFGFIKKQLNQPLENLIPYLYHYGKAGSGKTTMARIGLYFWGLPSVENDIGGSEADTIARLGKQVSKSTFPMIINEPNAIFNKKTLTETMKTAVERTNARRRFEGKTFQTILSLATIQFTSNFSLPNEEGLSRRFLQILYTHNEKKTKAEKEEFMKTFRMDVPTECRFNDLKPLANFALDYIKEHTEVLKLDWEKLSNKLIMQAYIRCARQVPTWLLGFVESITDDDLDEEESEELRMFFLEEINKKINRIDSDVYESPAGRNPKYVKTGDDFKDRVFNVINEQLIPYMGIHHSTKTDADYVYFTTGLKKALHSANQVCYDVKSIAELLGWKYGTVKINGKVIRVMRVRFEKFIRFLYPDYSNMEGNW